MSEFEGMDPGVLDRLLQIQKRKDQRGISRTICSIVQTDTFAVDDDDKLTPDEEKEVQSELEKTRLFRANPQAFHLQQIAEHQSFRQQLSHQTIVSNAGGSPTFSSMVPTSTTMNNSSETVSTSQTTSSEVNNFIPKIASQVLSPTSEDETYISKSGRISSLSTTEINTLASKSGFEIQSLTTVSSAIKPTSHTSVNTNFSKNSISKAQSPVAGANTKIAVSQSGSSNSVASRNPQSEEPAVGLISSTPSEIRLPENVKSIVSRADSGIEDALKKTSSEIQTNKITEKEALEDSDSKVSNKVTSLLHIH